MDVETEPGSGINEFADTLLLQFGIENFDVTKRLALTPAQEANAKLPGGVSSVRACVRVGLVCFNIASPAM